MIFNNIKNNVMDTQNESHIKLFLELNDVSSENHEELRLELFEAIVENITDLIIITEDHPLDSPGPIIVYVNNALTELTGHSRNEILGKSPRIFQGPKTDKKELNKLKTSLQKREYCEIEVINYKKNGEEFLNHFSVFPLANKTGEFRYFISIQRDVTEKRKILKDLFCSEELYKKLFYQNPVPIIIWNPETLKIIEVNEEACKQYGFSYEEMVGMSVLNIRINDEHESFLELARKFKEGIINNYFSRSVHLGRDGKEMTFDVTSHKVIYKDIVCVCVIAVLVNVSEKIELEETLKTERESHQRKITEALLSGQEKERNELSLELHDNVNQILTAAVINLGILKNKSEEPIKERLKESSDYIKLAISEIRRISKYLSMPFLNDTSFLHATRTLTQEMFAGCKIKYEINLGGFKNEDGFKEDFKINLFRIIQQTISNCIKHSKAKHFYLEIKGDDYEMVTIIMKDDGKGYDLSLKSKGIGMNNIEQRVNMYEGELFIESFPQKGYSMKIVIPAKNIIKKI